MAVRERQIQLQKTVGKLRCRTQTSRSLKEQHLCTGDTRHQQARKMDKQQAVAGKLREIAGKCAIAGNCEELRTSSPYASTLGPLICKGAALRPVLQATTLGQP